MRASLRFAAAVLLLVSPLVPPAGPGVAAPGRDAVPLILDAREPARRTFSTDGLERRRPGLAAPGFAAPGVRLAGAVTPAAGTVRQWPALDEVNGRFYRKDYTLRGVGEHVEVWVARDIAFPAGDCRPAASTVVTDAQVASLVREFDSRIHPRETAAFSTPPARDGSDPQLAGDFTGAGGRTVTLVDNVRDDNFYDFPASATYVAGFFSAQLNDLVDRNVMTIDAYDWQHRTGATPPDEPTGDLCTSRPARPRMYEGTFAHEWQHLLQHYTDPDEEQWLDEGLSDYAQSLVGYADTTATVHQRGADTHLVCFQGFAVVRTAFNTNPRECGGAQNSLNLWNEGEPAEVLADYGHAYQFLLYLHDRFGPGVLSRLHRDGRHRGLAAVRAALGPDVRLAGVLHDFQTMTLVDKVAGDGTAVGVPRERVTAPSLRSTVNLANPASYDRPGAAPNGADYVRLRGADGRALRGAELRSVVFRGARTLPPLPLTWTVRDGALFSGDASGTDAAAVLAVKVPARGATLTLRARYGAEKGYDYGYVTVSADGGRTYRAVAGDRTVAGPLGPGVTGSTDGFERHTYDLSAYAGRRVLLGFRYVSDAGVNEGGWYVDDVALGGRTLSDGSSLRGFRSPTQIAPVPVHAWAARLVGLDEAGRRVRQVPVERFALLRAYPKVVAVIAYDEPTGELDRYAPYTLTVNGVVQPGGGQP
ncbi:immune inhibitor A domain-containing protein [Pseudosporangium ferrugineum]|uniref:Immune inhibitor A peptidase M6 n=1 Tax=Pseudosporangium ferrugineum TaxID=439699 RepID=A0A2T0SJ42_9ACTN|nr:immune inhibitor A domain-containing protein [Pseudosporangium ferrugineum]PRY33421.1 immune inhibitor A peptidase M6 [Pseudosporangium ferrugineum]